jgi:hypothetical protein
MEKRENGNLKAGIARIAGLRTAGGQQRVFPRESQRPADSGYSSNSSGSSQWVAALPPCEGWSATMKVLLDWFGKRRKRAGLRGIGRLALAVELLEPRQLLAADGLGFITGLGPNWHPDGPTDGHSAVIQSVDYDAGWETASSRQAQAGTPELVFLDELVEQLGEMIEIDNAKPWSCDGDGYDDGLF